MQSNSVMTGGVEGGNKTPPTPQEVDRVKRRVQFQLSPTSARSSDKRGPTGTNSPPAATRTDQQDLKNGRGGEDAHRRLRRLGLNLPTPRGPEERERVTDPNHLLVLAWAKEQDRKQSLSPQADSPGPKGRPDKAGATRDNRMAEAPSNRNSRRWERANAKDRETAGESSSGGPEERNPQAQHQSNPVPKRPSTNNNPPKRLSKFLDNDPRSFFQSPVTGPDDDVSPPNWFIAAVHRLCGRESRTPSKPPFQFEASNAAAEFNARLMRDFDCDLSKLINAHSNTTLGYGSEFRSVEELTPLLKRHPNFLALENLLATGMPYVFSRELDPATKSEELQTLLGRGNHKSAQEESEQVKTLLAKDVLHGFSVPLPVWLIPTIPGAAVQPLGVAKQWTVQPDGSRVTKFRLTQDLSFTSNKVGLSRAINARVDMNAYGEMTYGWCLPRILHYVVSMRTHHPTTRILISKYDYSDAYRRIAHSAEAATQTIAVVEELAYLSLRLTFGGSPNPPTWCMFSELVTDLANELTRCNDWDPDITFSPAQAQVPSPQRLSSQVPLARAAPMAVLVPVTEGGIVDGFIDDLISVFLDSPSNLVRHTQAVPLAMHITSRPHAGDTEEPVPRRAILSSAKLEAEGSPAEVQIVLGWQIDTRRLLISLPADKFTAWTRELIELRNTKGSCLRVDLEALVGRLNHTAGVIPQARHFLSRIRNTLGKEGSRNRRVKLGPEAKADMVLWEKFLKSATGGISINLLVTRRPNRICWSDACPYGIGGYSLSGFAWRIQIPQSSVLHGSKKINNLLEFIGMAVNIWLSCQESDTDHDCILAIGDNTSAIGWLHNTARLDPTWAAHDAHLVVAQKVATLLMENSCCIASQHLKGELNLVADWLSFVGSAGRGKEHPLAFDNPPNDVLTARFHHLLPSQIPENFVIAQLPSEILSWIAQVLRIAESSLTEDRKGATKAATECGAGGPNSVTSPAVVMTPSSLCYPSSNGNSWLDPSSTSIALPIGTLMGDLSAIVQSHWSRALCAKPQATWQRRSGSISGRAPCTSRELPTCVPLSADCCKPLTTSTHQHGARKQSPPNSYEQCLHCREMGHL
jgi:hypothetical protein